MLALRPRVTWGWLTRRHALWLGAGLLLLGLCFRADVSGDGVGYYSYLPSIIAHRSFDVGPVFDRFINSNTPVARQFLEITLPNGLTADYKPVGAALLALPFYLVTHLIFLLVPGHQDPDVSAEYQLAFTAASLFYAVLAIVLLYRFLRSLFGPLPARLATAGVVLATPLVAYVLFGASYSHTFSVFTITAFAILLFETRRDRSRWQWFVCGLLGGLASITHVQEVLFLALIPAETIWHLRHRTWRPRWLGGYGLLSLGLALPVGAQLVVDRVIFERWLPQSAPNITFDFAHPHLLDLLMSTHHGWLSWSPLVALSFLGLPAVVRRLEWLGAGLLAVGVGEFWINASLSDWWGGNAFGARRLTDQSLLVGLGLAATFAWFLQRRWARVATFLVGSGVAWTSLLLAQYYYVIRVDVGPPWRDFLLGQIQAIVFVPRLFIQGTVLREAAASSWWLALYTGLVIAAVVVAALRVGLRGLPRIRGRRGGDTPRPGSSGRRDRSLE
ncbi:MAG: hypothetical protein WAT58_08905, partial [Candidatus Dormiibacterota bacterium]